MRFYILFYFLYLLNARERASKSGNFRIYMVRKV
jgi:hypothetical protein